MKVLMSIKPRYVSEIFNNNKLYEYRKVIFKEKVDKVIIYSSSPIMKVLGEFKVGSIIKASPEEVWNKTWKDSGITKEDFNKYYKNKEIAYTIEIIDVIKYEEPLNLNKYNILSPPQSFMYIKEPSS